MKKILKIMEDSNKVQNLEKAVERFNKYHKHFENLVLFNSKDSIQVTCHKCDNTMTFPVPPEKIKSIIEPVKWYDKAGKSLEFELFHGESESEYNEKLGIKKSKWPVYFWLGVIVIGLLVLVLIVK